MNTAWNKAISLLLSAKSSHIEIMLSEKGLQLKIPRNKVIDPQLLEDIKKNEKVLIEFLRSERMSTDVPVNSIIPFDRTLPEPVRLSYSQERLWFLDQFNGSLQYHMPWTFRIKGPLNTIAINASFKEIINRHEVLRTVVTHRGGTGYQELKEATAWEMVTIHERDETRIPAIADMFIERSFDLSKDYLLRVMLIQLSATEHILVIVIHHIAFDGWSIGIMVNELTLLYNAYINNTAAILPELSVQYSDYAIWQRKYLTGDVFEKKATYWKMRLEGVTPLDIFTDYPRPAEPGIDGGLTKKILAIPIGDQLVKLANDEGVTLFMLLLAVFKVQLYRYTHQQVICVGTPIAGREQAEIENLMGFFVNTLALSTEINDGISFRDLLQQIRAQTLEDFSHQEVPFEKVVEILGVERSFSHNPVFQVMFSVEIEEGATTTKFENVDFFPEETRKITSKVDLHLHIVLSPEGLSLSMVYSTDLYHASTIVRMLDHYEVLLTSVLTEVGTRIDELNILPLHESRLLLEEFNNTAVVFPMDKTIVDLFNEQVMVDPGRLALREGMVQITYHELNNRACQLASYLKEQGLQEEAPVVVCMERCADIMVAMLGILKAGGIYVPVDPGYPTARIRYMLEDTGAAIKITNSACLEKLEATGYQSGIICMDRDSSRIQAAVGTAVFAPATPEKAAYIIYTSGSTGQPKGVVVTHHSLSNLIHWHINNFKVDNTSRITAMAGIGFDAFGWEVWPALAAGAAIYFINDDDRMVMPLLLDFFAASQITHCFIPTALATDFVNESRNKSLALKYLLTGGDRLPVINLEGISYAFINNYGPTENTVVSTSYRLSPDHNALSVIGKPISNTQVYILDDRLQPVPLGATGELYVGGVQVAKAYLNLPDLTAARFLPDHLGKKSDAVLYRTGDKAKWLPDGNILFAGRADEQVKLRGFRIEPGEIEHVLQQAPGVKQAVVLLSDAGQPEKKLIAYIVPTDSYDADDVAAYLRGMLPDYMIPAALLPIDSIPLTSNGKTDKQKLSSIALPPIGNQRYEGARNKLEELLVGIWEEILKVKGISIHHNFFEMGGHSLMAMRMTAAIRKATGKDIAVKKLFACPTIALLSAEIAAATTDSLLPPIKLSSLRDHVPLSFQQQHLWFMHRLQGADQYNIPWVFRLSGSLDIVALNAAFADVISRHEVLRTVIKESNGIGYQEITADGKWKMNVVKKEDAPQNYTAIRRYIDSLINQPFELSSDSMLRVTLICIGENEYILVGVVHHIAFDGWSLGILVRELTALYQHKLTGCQLTLPPLQVQYADYAVWQRQYVTGNILDSGIAYWQQQLSNVAVLPLPADKVQQHNSGETNGAAASVFVNKEITAKLIHLAQQEGATLFMVLLSAFKALLYRYTGQKDICVGTTIAGRQLTEVENLIGYFINTVALRTQVDGSTSFHTLLQQVKQTTLNAYAYQHIPFGKVVEMLGIERETEKHPVFQAVFVLENTPESVTFELGDLVLLQEEVEITTSKFDMRCSASQTRDGLNLHMIYHRELYSEDFIRRMLHHFVNILSAIADDIYAGIGTIDLLDTDEREQLLIASANRQSTYPRHKTVADIFEEQAARTPDQVALVFDSYSLSYRELDSRSNQLAHYLKSVGVTAGALVAVCAERGLDMITGTLAILKAGAAYVPIDVGYPEDRIAYMLRDLSATVVLTTPDQESLVSNIVSEHTELTGTIIVNIDPDNIFINTQPQTHIQRNSGADDLAYMIYTSGSTGNAKGVMIRHTSLLDYVYGLFEKTRIKQCMSFALVSTLSADLGNTVVFASLLGGGILHILSRNTVNDGRRMLDYFNNNEIDCLKIVPSHWKALCTEEQLLLPRRLLIFGGEILNASMVADIEASGHACTIINHYGPTETTIGKLLYEVVKGKQYYGSIPIGKPFSNTQVFILNEQLQLCPVGIAGEIYIGGDGVATGYFRQPALTAAKFIVDPFSHIPGARLYKSGDLGKWLPDGNIEYLGRKDDQVKIRGYRIEPGEIAYTLESYEAIKRAVVLAAEDGRGDKYLAAFVVAGEPFDKEMVTGYLRSKLPDYMIPLVIISLPEIPLTPNGKIDRKKILQEITQPSSSQVYEAARNETEQVLVSIWEELLEIENIGVHDNFFELGGHSLLAVRVISAIRKQLGKEIPIVSIFDHPTIARLFLQLSAMQEKPVVPAIRHYDKTDHIPLSYSQERLWFIDKLQGSRQYHMPRIFRLNGALDLEALHKAFQAIVARHEILRTVIKEEAGIGYQVINPPDSWKMTYVHLSEIVSGGSELSSYIIEKVLSQPYNLTRDNILKVTLIETASNEYVLAIMLHHIAFDGWSLSVMAKELVELYNSFRLNKPSTLSPLPVQYADYAIWQREHLSGEILDTKLAYWKKKLEGLKPLELPLDGVRPVIQSIRGNTLGFTIGKELTDQVNAFSQEQGVTLFMTLLTLFKVLLYRYTEQEDIAVGTPVANRLDGAAESMIGFFVNTLVLRSDLSGAPDFLTMLQRVKNNALEAYAYQDTPFEKVVEAVSADRNMTYTPLFQVLFVLQNTPEVQELDLTGITCTMEHLPHNTSKFDLFFNLVETEQGIEVQIEYCTDLFNAGTISRMFGHYLQLMSAAMEQPSRKVSALEMLIPAEKILLNTFSNGEEIDTGEETFLEIFEAQVNKTPDAVAVVFDRKEITYTTLNSWANFLACDLIRYGVGEDALVAICAERSLEMIIGIIAILKAGAAYVPMDPRYPQDRIDFILNDTAAAVVLTTSACSGKVRYKDNRTVIEMDAHPFVAMQQDKKNPGIKISEKGLGYVIYTSGSTGFPKGVALPLKALTNLIKWQLTQQEGEADRNILQFASLNFDVSFQEIFSTLCSGSTLYLIDEDERKDMRRLVADIERQQITGLFIPFVVLKNIAEYAAESNHYPNSLREIFTAGEQLRLTRDIQLFMEKTGAKLYNQYGPSEAHVVSAYEVQDIDYDTRQLPPVGKPVWNTQLYITDTNNNICGIGIPGLLHIGGVQVARGYINAPELSASRFGPDHFSGKAHSRLYCSGDKARWLPDGNIEFLGRMDDQVKIRGHRVELGEVEALIQRAVSVKNVVVIAREDGTGSKQLIAYVVSEGAFDRTVLQEYMKMHLPEYMIPGIVIPIDQIPVTANGKIDKKRLPDAGLPIRLSPQYESPRNETEEKITQIWQHLLSLKEVSIHDNFFEIGGHSLLVTRLASAIRNTFEIEISISTFFQLTTPASIAAYIDVQQLNTQQDADKYEAIKI